MPLIAEADLQVTITRPGRSVPSTRSDLTAPLSRQTGRDQWKRIIDQFKEWQKDSSFVDDEDYEPPRSHVIAEAIELAIDLRNANWFPPKLSCPMPEVNLFLNVATARIRRKSISGAMVPLNTSN